MRKVILAVFAALTFSLAAHAAIEVYEFDNLEQEQQFKELGQLLAMYNDDAVMKDAAVVRCKLALEFYVWERAISLMDGLPGG